MRPIAATVLHPVDVHVGARIRLRRGAIAMSRAELAFDLGQSDLDIVRYERGGERFSASQLYRIAGALQVNVGYFFEDVGRLTK